MTTEEEEEEEEEDVLLMVLVNVRSLGVTLLNHLSIHHFYSATFSHVGRVAQWQCI